MSSVWVQLHIKGENGPSGEPIKIKPAPDDVSDLKEAVKTKLQPKIDYAPLNEIFVYPPRAAGVAVGDHYKPGRKLADLIEELKDTSDDHPLILVAPAPHLQQPDHTWFKVSGKISRPVSHARARYQLYKLAVAHGGLYPPVDKLMVDKRSAFSTSLINEAHSVVSFAVVFQDVAQVAQFINGITLYLMKNKNQLVLLNDGGSATEEPTVTQISSYPINHSDIILQTHYKPRDGEAEPGSPLIDMVVDVCSSDITVDVTFLSRRDPTFQFQRIENDHSFGLADPESAHIFPSAKCNGIYEWLDRPEFNRLALSRDVHSNFDGTRRGRGKRRKTQQTFAIKPLRLDNGYAMCTIADIQCYKINEIADTLISKLRNDAVLHKHNDRRWTIDGSDVAVYHPKGRRVSLTIEETDNGTLSLVTGIPGVEDLNDCWSNSPTNLYSVEAAEIMEKCLIWNHHNALQSWSWFDVLASSHYGGRYQSPPSAPTSIAQETKQVLLVV